MKKIIVILLFTSLQIFAEDLGYRWSDENQRCEKDGQNGKNPHLVFECGDIDSEDSVGNDFSGANLKGIWFRDVNLSSRNFSKSDIRFANIARSPVSGSVFDGADLSFTHLHDSVSNNVSFKGIKGNQFHIYLAALNDSDFSDSQLVGADFYKCSLKSALFKGSDLSRAQFTLSRLTFANFENTNLQGVDFRNTDISKANFAGSNLNKSWYDECTQLPFSEREAIKRGMLKADRGGLPCKDFAP